MLSLTTCTHMYHITEHLRSGILKVEPKTGLLVPVVYWGSALSGTKGANLHRVVCKKLIKNVVLVRH